MDKKVDFNSVSKEQLIYARKNMAFNAVMFVWQSFLSVINSYDGEETAKSYMDSFKSTYDLISKPFVPTFSNDGEEGHEPFVKSHKNQ